MKGKTATGFKSVFLSYEGGKSYEYRFQSQGVRYRKGGFKTALDASKAYVIAHREVLQQRFCG